MKKFLVQFFAVVAISLALIACSNGEEPAVQQESADEESQNTGSQNNPTESADSLVQFPENYEEGVLYTTVTRGSTFEELYASRETIEAVQNGEPIPSGAVVTLKIFEDGEVDKIFVMEKRSDWDPEQLPEQRNGDWAYQSFTPEGDVNGQADIGSCISCHASQESEDFLYKRDEMETFDLEASASEDSRTAAHFTDSHAEGWGVMEVEAEAASPTQVGQAGEMLSLDDPETKGIIQNVLFRMYVNELEG
ncbi:cytochrome P460 family protein [Cytobacillus pseudoceanisediminis]|uniref:cytochrome P460 family protein n=1 Tax=Cytobacillus pseudoceanisediminis TaxID=3051614 RepID=UPI003C2C7335